MKALLSILYSIILLASVQGQEKYIKKAQNYVDNEKYEKALKTLEKADPILTEPFLNDFNLVKGLALDGLGYKDSALYFYEDVILEKNLNEIPAKVLVDYANSLFHSGDYNGALFFITRARESLFGTKYPEGLEQIADKCQWAINNMDKFSASMGKDSILDVRIGVHDLLVDVPTFGAAYFKDSLVFASYTEYKKPNATAEEAFEHNEILQDYQHTNTDLYIASMDDKIGEKRLFSEEIQSLNNEGALTFNKAMSKMYFTRHYVDKHGEDKYKIYYAAKENGHWIDKGPLNFNSDEFSCLQPSLSADEKTLYFVSNNPGGFGGYDIYSSTGKGSVFEMPKNLGPQINSAGDEIFPYMNDDSTLIFSSNGLLGFGGYDIYWVNMNHEEKQAFNLLQPINSNSDDYCIVGNRNKPEQMLFFSDRDMSYGAFAFGEKADDQTLSFNIELLTPERRASGNDYTLFLSKGESVLKPVVENIKRKELEKQLAQNSNIVNGKIITTVDGHVLLIDSISGELINVPGNIEVAHGKVVANDEGSFVLVDSLSGNTIDITKVTTELIAEKTELEKKRKVLEEELAQNSTIDNGKIIETEDGQLVVIDSVSGEIVDIPNNLASATGKVIKKDDGYTIVDKFTGETITKDDLIAVEEESFDDQIDVPAGEQGSKLKSIFFNKNSSELSDESKKNLEMVAAYLRAKPQMKLVISGHASMRGNHSYNLCISAHRAKQTLKFLTENMNISESNFILVANGKYFPLIRTFNVESGLENRRVDLIANWTKPQSGIEVNFKIEKVYTGEFESKLFRIFKMQNPDVDYLHMAEDGKSLTRIANIYGTTVESLKKMNNLGDRNYLYKNEVIMVVPFKMAVREMVFKAKVQDLLYLSKDTNIEVIATKYGISAQEILRVNGLTESELKEHTRLIIPLIDNNK